MSKSKLYSSKFMPFLAIIIVILGSVSIYFLNVESNKFPVRKPFNLKVDSSSIKINGWGDLTIDIKDIQSIKLVDSPLSVDFNLGGGNINNVIWGKEYISNYGSSICFVEDLNNPSIYITTNSDKYFINLSSKDQTISYFNKLKDLKQQS